MNTLSRRDRRLIGFVLTLLAALPLHAANFCVATGNQLAAALTTAGSNDEDDIIKIEFGTLTSDTEAPQNYQWIFDGRGDEYGTTISGGWSKGNGCASIATNDPAATVLDAQYAGPVFLADLRFDFSGTFAIRNLALARGKVFGTPCISGSVGIDCASGLGVQAWALPGASVTIDNVLIRNGVAAAGASDEIVDVYMTGGGTLRLRNSIVMGNDLGAGANTSGVQIVASGNTIVYVTNNSIFGNTVTSDEVGLSVTGVATLSNNAVADNVTTGDDPPFQFSAHSVSTMTLRSNHFANRQYVGGGFPFSETGTTTGDAQWTQSGVRMTPNSDSVLRDSGVNSPSGGIPAIDFSGKARIINTVIDRGAVEANVAPPIGPNIVPNAPGNASTTLVYGVASNAVQRTITFSTSGGNSGGSTELLCGVTSGTAQVVANGNQTVPTGGTAGPVTVNIPVTTTPQTHTVLCSYTRDGNTVGTYTYHFRAMADALFGNGFE
jgi:hypothetical protein